MKRPRDPLVQVVAARASRVAFGAVLVGGAVAMVAAVVFALHAGWPGRVLFTTMPLAVVVSLLVRGAFLRLGPVLAERQRALGGGPTRSVAALSSPVAAVGLGAFAERLERPSYTLPLVGLALMMPLTLHTPFSLGDPRAVVEMSQWIFVSLLLTTFAHVTLAALSFRFARRLQEQRLRCSAEREGLVAVGWTTLAGAVPGLFLPAFIVAVTGALFVPLSFEVIARAHRRERGLLAKDQGAEAVEVVKVA